MPVVWAIAALPIRSAAANNAVFILILLGCGAGGKAPSILARRALAPVDGGETIRFGFFSLPLKVGLRVECITG
jgi:hypothetical protein